MLRLSKVGKVLKKILTTNLRVVPYGPRATRTPTRSKPMMPRRKKISPPQTFQAVSSKTHHKASSKKALCLTFSPVSVELHSKRGNRGKQIQGEARLGIPDPQNFAVPDGGNHLAVTSGSVSARVILLTHQPL